MKRSEKVLMLSHKSKIIDCLNSCKTSDQLASVDRMIETYHSRFNDSKGYSQFLSLSLQKEFSFI